MPATYRDTETGKDRIVLDDAEKKRLIEKRRQKRVDELTTTSLRNHYVTDLARGFLLGEADALTWVMRVLNNNLTPEDMEA